MTKKKTGTSNGKKLSQEWVCSLGSISTRERCCYCGKNLKHDEFRGGCFCPSHPDIHANKYIVRFGNFKRTYKSYEEATRALSYFRYRASAYVNETLSHDPHNEALYQYLSHSRSWIKFITLK